MKIGIITFHNVINYGATLQALALQESIRKKSQDVSIINYTPIDVFSAYKPFSLIKNKRYAKNSLKRAVKSVASDARHFWFISKRNKTFNEFGKKYFNYSGEACQSLDKLKKSLPDYDVCFAGSDQIWNPDITYGFDSAYFLDFGKKNMVRASYAASIGRETFNSKEKQVLCEYLNEFDYISLRERTAQNLLNTLTDKPIEVVLDPTLLLNANDWRRLFSIQPQSKEYIFVYTLYPNPKLNLFVEKLSKLKNLPVVTINRKPVYSNEVERYPLADPCEFVSLIANAQYVVTNSFHGTAFSVNFSKNFITFTGERRNSRITDLLKILGISERAVADFSDELLDMDDIDYEKVQSKLNEERNKSEEYIDSVLERAGKV